MKSLFNYIKSKYVFLVFGLIIIQSARAQSAFFEKSGDVLQVVLPAAAFGSTFIYKDGTKPTWQFAKTFGTTMILTHTIKRITDKRRPNGGYHAFPSGHTASAFTSAAFIQKRYGWKWGAPSYVLASLTGWSRIESNHHDFWDVLGGAVVGILSAQVFTKAYDDNILELTFDKSQDGFYLALSVKI